MPVFDFLTILEKFCSLRLRGISPPKRAAWPMAN
jgi:hypothetical protein